MKKAIVVVLLAILTITAIPTDITAITPNETGTVMNLEMPQIVEVARAAERLVWAYGADIRGNHWMATSSSLMGIWDGGYQAEVRYNGTVYIYKGQVFRTDLFYGSWEQLLAAYPPSRH